MAQETSNAPRFYEHWIIRGRISGSPVPTAVPRVAQKFVPHIYSNDELRRLLAAVDENQARRGCQISASTFRLLRGSPSLRLPSRSS
jgi:hypothetical protein